MTELDAVNVLVKVNVGTMLVGLELGLGVRVRVYV